MAIFRWPIQMRTCRECKTKYSKCDNDIGLCDKCINNLFRHTIHKEIKKMGYPV